MKPNRLWIAGLFVVAVAILAICTFTNPATLEGFFDEVKSLGHWGPLMFIGAYIVATLTFAPGILINLAAGALFGVFFGSIYALVGSTLGALAAFYVGRAIGREQLSKWFGDRILALDAAVGREGFKIVVLARLAPGLSFTVLNFAFGLTRVSLRDFVLGSLVGMLPWRIAYAYVGSVVKDVARVRAKVESLADSNWMLVLAGFVVTVIFLLWVARISRRAMQAYLDPPRETVSGSG